MSASQHSVKILLIRMQLVLIFLYLILINAQTQVDSFNDSGETFFLSVNKN